ncbi:MAG: hypothetical protein WC680_10115 [Sulfuricurvum sp.]
MKKNILLLMSIIVGNAVSADVFTLECKYEMLCKGEHCRTPAYVTELYEIDLEDRSILIDDQTLRITKLTDQMIIYERDGIITGTINRFNGELIEIIDKKGIRGSVGNCKKVNAKF